MLKLAIIAVIAALILAYQPAFADPLVGDVTRQRIGNYDFEIATEPSPPQAGEPAQIMLRVAGVNGDDLIDVPLEITIEKDGQRLQRIGPLVAPFGHYEYTYVFSEPGRYMIQADLRDYLYSDEVLTFTFFVSIPGPLDYVVPGAGAVVAAILGAIVLLKRRTRLKGKIP